MKFPTLTIPITGVWLDPIKPSVDPLVTDDWDVVAAHERETQQAEENWLLRLTTE